LVDTTPPDACYYVDPLGMPPLDLWQEQFARIHDMGFDTIVLAPPFRSSSFDELHTHLGGGDATLALTRICGMARASALRVILDLRTAAVEDDALLLREHPDWRAAEAEVDPLPDPRRKPGLGTKLRDPAPDALLGWWHRHILRWADAGIAGFRCLDVDLGGRFWKALIGAARESHPQLRFIAWTHGLSPAQVNDLVDTGFDLTASSLPWWNFEDVWWGEEAARLALVAPILTMPEAPFGPRLASRHGAGAALAAERALRFAALTGAAWLLPMGFEYGALHRMERSPGRADARTRPSRSPPIDLTDTIRVANRERRSRRAAVANGPPVVISAPTAPVTQVLQKHADGRHLLVLVNPFLDRAATASPAPLADAAPHKAFVQGEARLVLEPASVRSFLIEATEPIRLQPGPGEASASAFAQSPRIVIEALAPSIDSGRFAAKRIVGHPVTVTADVFADGATKLAVRLLWRAADEDDWREVPMRHTANDAYSAEFVPDRVGRYVYTVCAWVDAYAAFLDEVRAKYAAGIDIALERREGLALLRAACANLTAVDARRIEATVAAMPGLDASAAVALFGRPDTIALMRAADPRPFQSLHEPALPMDVERRGAGFASWYELFPRSQSGDVSRHGTLQDVIAQLPRVRDMGFDVLYFPPIHPIGTTNRKGRNNTLTATPGDPGSPYAIGAEEGGHDALHPALGTLEDFKRLIGAAADHGLEIALDFAIQCSPDHPWLREHPGWFAYRPDGTIRYAENPPKKYEDIVNVDFYAKAAVPDLWIALRDVVLFWVAHGVKLFRVDNPHTKPLPFWEWMIGEVRAREPDCVFLSEAFTRPKVMYRLAKVGFSQSYTYFTWRNEAWELGEYMAELNRAPASEFFRPHFFVNTPDINPTFLQRSGRPGHLVRAALAATLSGLWGVYNGFELCEATPLRAGKEEYLDSEKYELRAWDHDRPGNIIAEITALNRIRRQNPALHTHLGVTILASGHQGVLAYVKATPDRSNVVLVAVSMDPATAVETHMQLPQAALGLPHDAPLLAQDLMSGVEHRWEGSHRLLRLDPQALPFAIWRLRAADRN
jgi:starch synthase (maltosyl-transferring)